MQTSNPSEKDNMTNNSAFFTSTDLKYQVSSFPGDKLRDYPEYLRALLQVCLASAKANGALGYLTPEKVSKIEQGCQILLADPNALTALDQTMIRFVGKPAQRAVDSVIRELTGGAVSGKEIALNQFTADVTTTAEGIAVRKVLLKLSDHVRDLSEAIGQKAKEFAGIVKCGRLGLKDSLPMRLEDEFAAYQSLLQHSADELAEEAKGWNVCLLGSGDVGNGLGVLPGFAARAKADLEEQVGYPLASVEPLTSLLNNKYRFIVAHAKVQAAADIIWKIARDLTILSSGPRAGIREMILPAVAPGSSIMPGKINPTVAELIMHLCDKVFSNAAGLNIGVHSGWLGSDSHSSLPLKCMLDSCTLLSDGCEVFKRKVISGLTANKERSAEHARMSLALQMPLAQIVGEDKAREVARYAYDNDLTLEDAYTKLAGNPAPDSLEAMLFNVEVISGKEGASEFMKRLSRKPAV